MFLLKKKSILASFFLYLKLLYTGLSHVCQKQLMLALATEKEEDRGLKISLRDPISYVSPSHTYIHSLLAKDAGYFSCIYITSSYIYRKRKRSRAYTSNEIQIHGAWVYNVYICCSS
jgi:hypothetical protein